MIPDEQRNVPDCAEAGWWDVAAIVSAAVVIVVWLVAAVRP